MSDTMLTVIAWFVIVRYAVSVIAAIAKPGFTRQPLTGWHVAALYVLSFASVICAMAVLGWIG